MKLTPTEVLERNPDSASDGDRDIAFALIAAYKKWGSGGIDYETAARDMLIAIWDLEVITPTFADDWDDDTSTPSYASQALIRADDGTAYRPDVYYMTTGNWAKNPRNMFVGVGYASPATLRVFDEFAKNHDLDHNWEQVAIDFYTILERTHESMTSGLPPIGEQIFTGEHPFSNGLLLPAWTLPAWTLPAWTLPTGPCQLDRASIPEISTTRSL